MSYNSIKIKKGIKMNFNDYITNPYYLYITNKILDIPNNNLNSFDIKIICYHFINNNIDILDETINKCFAILSSINNQFPNLRRAKDQFQSFALLVINNLDNIEEKINIAFVLFRRLDKNNLMLRISKNDLKEIYDTIINNSITSNALYTMLKDYDFTKFSKEHFINFLIDNNPDSNPKERL